VVLSVDPVKRRMSFSLKQAAPADPVSEAASTEAAPQAKKKKRPELRGGLDF
jgi:hypothetical protein